MDSDDEIILDDDDFYMDEDEDTNYGVNINKMDDGNPRDILEEKLEKAEIVFEKLHTYIMVNGLNFLDKPRHLCISNMLPIISIN